MKTAHRGREVYLSVVIPAFNEERRLAGTLASVRSFLDRQPYESEIVIANDGSTDGTSRLARSAAAADPRLTVIDSAENRGKGYAVRAGMLAARGAYRLFMDADGSTPIEEVDKLLAARAAAGSGAIVAIGSRRAPGARIEREQSLVRLALGRAFRGIVEFVAPLGVVDSQNGFKLFSAEAAEAVFSRQTVFGWAFDVEILRIARRLGYELREVPVVWSNDRESRVTLPGMVRMLGEVLEIRFRT